MEIIKRDGTKVNFTASKLQTRVKKTAKGLKVDADTILLDVFKGISDGITTSEIDNLIAEISAGYTTKHYDYSIFAARVLESRLEKDVPEFFEAMDILVEQNIISKEQLIKVHKFRNVIEEELNNPNQPILDYLGIRTFSEVYAVKNKTAKIYETPKYYRIRLALFFSETEEEFWENINELKSGYSPPTPTMCNAGTTENQLASCQLHYLVDDSTEGLHETFGDLAHSSRMKAGIGLAAYNQRAKGTKSSKGWGAAGQVKAMKIANEYMGFFDQGGKRPGSTAWYSTPWHREIFDFLKAKKVTTHESIAARDMFYALWCEDEFMKRVENKDNWYLFCPHELKKAGLDFIEKWGEDFSKEYQKAIDLFEKGELEGDKILAEDLWKEIYVTQVETGMPYMGFKDTVNEMNSQSNLGTIKSSNLCVSPNTKILTINGYVEIHTLEDEYVDIWNGEEWSEVQIVKTGESKNLLKVTTDSGYELECTPEHKFYIQNSYNKKDIEKVEASELQEGDRLIKFSLPVIEGSETLKYAYTQGFFSGDGYCDDNVFKSLIYLYGEKKKLLPYFDYRVKYTQNGAKSKPTEEPAILIEDAQNRSRVSVPFDIINDKSFVPDASYTVQSRLTWLSGMLDSDGTVTNNQGSQSFQIASINKQFLQDIQLMLQTLGCDSKVTFRDKGGMKMMPANDGTGQNKLYNCKDSYRLLINGSSMFKLSELGLECHRLKWEVKKPNRECSQFIKIKSVEELPDLYDTFCFKEKKRGMGMFNGILTGQCHEIVQYTSPDTTAVCVLTSLVLPFFVDDKGNILYEKLEKSLNLIVRNLNISIDRNRYATTKAEKGAKQQRAIAIGCQGLSDVFFKLGIAYDSQEALELTAKLQEAIHYYTIKGSVEYSKKVGKRLFEEDSIYPIERGEFQWEKYGAKTSLDWENLRQLILKYGVANSMFNGQMPTATSAQMHGSTESYESLMNNIYSRRLKVGEITVINKYLVKAFEDLGIWNSDLSDDLILAGGSVQELNIYDYIDIPTKEQKEKFENIREVFKTSWEISQKARTNICIAMQPFVDQAISMNVFYKDPTIARWSSALFYAWRNKLKTGNYYCRTYKATGNKSLGITKKDKLAEMINKSKNADPEDCEMCSS